VEHPEAEALLAAWPALGSVERVRVTTGPVKRLWAEIDTPAGRVFLA
jgi:hypothetical protein